MPSLDDPAATAPIAPPKMPATGPRPRKAANSLAAFKTAAPAGAGEALLVDPPRRTRKRRAKTGPKAKPKAELYSEQIALMLTPDQRKKLEAKAGLAPMGKYVRHILETQTDIFKAG